MQAATTLSTYPVDVSFSYPGRTSRLTAFFRFLLAIPVAIVMEVFFIAFGVTSFLAWWAILFTGRYPRGMFDFGSGVLRMSTQVGAYMYLLTDEYPPFSGNDPKAQSYPTQMSIEYPERSSRLLLFFRGILLFPHYIFGLVMGLVAAFVHMLGWFAVIITGRYPDGLRNFTEGFLRYGTRVGAYMYMMTDKYPPFSLSA